MMVGDVGYESDNSASCEQLRVAYQSRFIVIFDES
jgi:hypothetical protein